MENINFTALIYDTAVLAIVLGMIKRGTRTGFTRSFVRAAGYVLSTAVAVVISRLGSVLVYHTFTEPKLAELLVDSLSFSGSAGSLLSDLKEALSSLPAISFVLFDLSDATGSALEKIAGQSAEIVAETVIDEVVSPVVCPMLRGIIFALVFFLGCVIVRAAVKSSGIVRKIPVVGVFDRFLGGIFGIIEGLIVVALACVLIYMILSLWEGRWGWLSRSVISESFIFKWIYLIVTGDSLI